MQYVGGGSIRHTFLFRQIGFNYDSTFQYQCEDPIPTAVAGSLLCHIVVYILNANKTFEYMLMDSLAGMGSLCSVC
jgi:hypothetical protein